MKLCWENGETASSERYERNILSFIAVDIRELLVNFIKLKRPESKAFEISISILMLIRMRDVCRRMDARTYPPMSSPAA